VEIALPFAALAEHAGCPCPPRTETSGGSTSPAVEWRHEIKDGHYVRVPALGAELVEGNREDNWVWSPRVQSTCTGPRPGLRPVLDQAGGGGSSIAARSCRPVRYLLHRVLYAQEAYILEKGAYATGLSALGLEDLGHPSLIGPVRLTGDGQTYTVEAQVRLDGGRTGIMRLHQDGREELTDAAQDKKNLAQ